MMRRFCVSGVVMMWLLGLPPINDLYNDFVKLLRRLLIREEKAA